MSQPNEVDELSAEFSQMLRRLKRDVKEAIASRRAPRGARRDLTAGNSPEQRQLLTRLAPVIHGDLRIAG